MAGAKRSTAPTSLASRLEALVAEALRIARKARRHHKNLAADNFYGNKLAELRADAANIFSDLAAGSAGDTAALVELLQSVFAPDTAPKERTSSARELIFAVRTTWRAAASAASPTLPEPFFPTEILSNTSRGYIVSIGSQMNGCYAQAWYDACAVMMRRLLEIAIIEAFEHRKIAGKIKDAQGNYLQLTDLVGRALAEPAFNLSRNVRKHLPLLRDAGHMSAHGRYYHARKEDLDRLHEGGRVVIEEFFHHANLL